MSNELEKPKDEPLKPDEEAKMQAHIEALRVMLEAKSAEMHGPPEVRARKNQEYADALVRRYTEPVIRGLLTALSRLKTPLCAQMLAALDLTSYPLAEIIQPFEYGGRRFDILSVNGAEYTVEISISLETEGDGGQFVITRNGDSYAVKQCLEVWIC